jgi:hypothetical protein
METFKVKPETMDSTHSETVKGAKERQKRAAEVLGRRMAEFKKRGRSIERTGIKMERHHKMRVEGR